MTTTHNRFKAKNGLDNNGKTIINVATPVNGNDAVNKTYVDTADATKQTTYPGQLTGVYFNIANLSPASNATDWYRIATFASDNSPRKTKFLLAAGTHLNMEVEFSPGAGGDFARLAVKLLGCYVYYPQYPMDWRLVTDGTNAACHVDVRFSANTSNAAITQLTISVLEQFDLYSGGLISYPCTNVGSSNSTASTNWPIRIGTVSGFTYREFIVVPGNYQRTSTALVVTTGSITSGTIVT